MKIVCIGGGHGLAQMLLALKPLNADTTAIVATTDNGGSTGEIRKNNDVIALGDIRRCILALAEDNDLLTVMAKQRFEHCGQLSGHSLGNLMLLALTQISSSPTDAITWLCHLLGVEQTILPMSDTPVDLVATLANGKQVLGECSIDALKTVPETVALSDIVFAPLQATSAILNADYVFIGPGSALTSVLPPLLVPNIQHALQKTLACRVFIENVAKEQSVADLQPLSTQEWLSQLLGFQFNDITITTDAISLIDQREHTEQHNLKNEQLHDLNTLNHVLSQFLKPNYINSHDLSNQTLH